MEPASSKPVSDKCRSRRIATPAVLALAVVLALAGCGSPRKLPPKDATDLPPLEQPLAPVILQVGLAENQETLDIVLAGPCHLTSGHDGEREATLEQPGLRLTCIRQGQRVVWSAGEASGKLLSLMIRPVDPDGRLTYGDQAYRGDFLVIVSPTGAGLTLINTIDLEAYLRGVVPWEIGRHPQEFQAALEAQAIAARTYTISHLQARRNHGFDVFASVMDQVYRGATGEDELCNAAIEATAGLVLRWQGEEIDAYYSACCGGMSSRIESVWPRGGQAYLTEHFDGPARADGDHDMDDAFCAESKYFTWRETWNASQLEAQLQETLPAYIDYMSRGSRARWAGALFSPRQGGVDPDLPGAVFDYEILGRTPSGRVAHLAVTTTAGTYHVRGDRVRWVLRPASGRPAILRSALFDIEIERDEQGLQRITAVGRGFGHGIGLCQTGALAMAERDYTAREILEHYYPGALLARVGAK